MFAVTQYEAPDERNSLQLIATGFHTSQHPSNVESCNRGCKVDQVAGVTVVDSSTLHVRISGGLIDSYTGVRKALMTRRLQLKQCLIVSATMVDSTPSMSLSLSTSQRTQYVSVIRPLTTLQYAAPL